MMIVAPRRMSDLEHLVGQTSNVPNSRHATGPQKVDFQRRAMEQIIDPTPADTPKNTFYIPGITAKADSLIGLIGKPATSSSSPPVPRNIRLKDRMMSTNDDAQAKLRSKDELLEDFPQNGRQSNDYSLIRQQSSSSTSRLMPRKDLSCRSHWSTQSEPVVLRLDQVHSSLKELKKNMELLEERQLALQRKQRRALRKLELLNR
jgi:hypothetical protein